MKITEKRIKEIIEEERTETDEIIDNLLGEDEILEDLIKSVSKNDFLYFSTNYNNKTYFSGRDIGIDQFNVDSQLTYMNSNGLFIGLSGLYYSEFTPRWDYTAATVGYGKSFGKHKNIYK